MKKRNSIQIVNLPVFIFLINLLIAPVFIISLATIFTYFSCFHLRCKKLLSYLEYQAEIDFCLVFQITSSGWVWCINLQISWKYLINPISTVHLRLRSGTRQDLTENPPCKRFRCIAIKKMEMQFGISPSVAFNLDVWKPCTARVEIRTSRDYDYGTWKYELFCE